MSSRSFNSVFTLLFDHLCGVCHIGVHIHLQLQVPADRTRDRSRSPGPRDPITPEKLEQLKETYRMCKVQKRGGDKHRRRLKGVCCGLLRFLIQLCIKIVQNCSSATDPRIDIYKKRQRQAERRLQEVIYGWLPRRDENILDLGEDSEAESEIREKVAISSEEEEEEQEPETLAGVWFDSSSDLSSRIRSAPRISASNPLLVRSHQQQQRQQQLVNHALLERHGVRCNPEVRYRFEGLLYPWIGIKCVTQCVLSSRLCARAGTGTTFWTRFVNV